LRANETARSLRCKIGAPGEIRQTGGFITVATSLDRPSISARRSVTLRSGEGRMRREHRHVWKKISLFVRLLAYYIEREPSWLTGLLLPLLVAICVVIVIVII
jgi:hypothetical protein